MFWSPVERRKRDLKNEVCPCVLLAGRLSVRPSFRPSVRSLPRYLRIALIDFDEIFRKVQSYAKLERDIFGFLKKCFFVRILGKKGQNMSKKIQKTFFSSKSYFLPIFENMNVEGWGMFWATTKKWGPKWVKTGLKAGHRKCFEHFFKKVLFSINIWKYLYPVSYRGTHDTFTCFYIRNQANGRTFLILRVPFSIF